MPGCAVIVGREVSHALELQLDAAFGVFGYEWFHLGVLDNFERVRVEHLAEIAFGLCRRILDIEQSVV